MARAKLIDTEVTLDATIVAYADHKEELDKIKKVCDAENKTIKGMLTAMPETSDGKWQYETGGVIAMVNTTKKQTFNEDRLIEVLRDTGIEGVIKQKEYVDMEVLEDAMYKQLIGHDVMMEIDGCREVKETQVLTIKKVKE